MGTLLRRHPVAFLLAALAVVLASIVAIEAAVGFGHWRSATVAAPKTAPAAEAKLIPPMTVTQAEQAYPETASRPLFTPTRRPAPAAPVAGGSMAKGQFTLQGVIGIGGLQIALLREKSNGRVHRVEKGKEVNGITLSAVEPDKVTLSQGGDSEVVALAVQKGPAVAAAAPAPAPAAGAAGPFAPPSTAAAAPPPGAPAQPQVPPPVAARPPGAPPGAAPPVNPATRSGFGPFAPGTPPPTTSGTEQPGAAMTPEELLARRRARRAQMQGQPPQN
jgi:general secretion pathway protein N